MSFSFISLAVTKLVDLFPLGQEQEMTLFGSPLRAPAERLWFSRLRLGGNIGGNDYLSIIYKA